MMESGVYMPKHVHEQYAEMRLRLLAARDALLAFDLEFEQGEWSSVKGAEWHDILAGEFGAYAQDWVCKALSHLGRIT